MVSGGCEGVRACRLLVSMGKGVDMKVEGNRLVSLLFSQEEALRGFVQPETLDGDDQVTCVRVWVRC